MSGFKPTNTAAMQTYYKVYFNFHLGSTVPGGIMVISFERVRVLASTRL